MGEVCKDAEEILKLATAKGDVAQLARALDWQSRGRRFESALLHLKTGGLQRCSPFFVASLVNTIELI